MNVPHVCVPHVCVLGIFVADAAFRTPLLPRMGETVMGRSFALGPGGKGSNQAVAAGKALGGRGKVTIITRLGDDGFADMAEATWASAGVEAAAQRDGESHTGAAAILIDDLSGDNAIVVSPGAAASIGPDDIDAHAEAIRAADVFVTQLEQPLPAARHALRLAREAKTRTILNPAPAPTDKLPDDLLALCDILTPNETEAERLTGIAVETLDDAKRAAEALRSRGVGAVVVTLGERGALLVDEDGATHVPAFRAGPVVETTGAGDAFNGALAVALAEGASMREAVRFGCAAASISVTRAGAAASSPTRNDIDRLTSS